MILNPHCTCNLVWITEADGCIEDFVNTAAFSREYQAAQDCMCDSEHMFDCPGNTEENELETLARSIDNEGLNNAALDKIVQGREGDDEHKVVAKKYFTRTSRKAPVQQ